MSLNINFDDPVFKKYVYQVPKDEDVKFVEKRCFSRVLAASIFVIGNAIAAALIIRNLPTEKRMFSLMKRTAFCSPLILFTNALVFQFFREPFHKDPQVQKEKLSSAVKEIEKFLDSYTSDHNHYYYFRATSLRVAEDLNRMGEKLNSLTVSYQCNFTYKSFFKEDQYDITSRFITWVANRYLEKKYKENPSYKPDDEQKKYLKILALRCIEMCYSGMSGLCEKYPDRFNAFADHTPFLFSSDILDDDDTVFQSDSQLVSAYVLSKAQPQNTTITSVDDCFNGKPRTPPPISS